MGQEAAGSEASERSNPAKKNEGDKKFANIILIGELFPYTKSLIILPKLVWISNTSEFG